MYASEKAFGEHDSAGKDLKGKAKGKGKELAKGLLEEIEGVQSCGRTDSVLTTMQIYNVK